MRPLPLCSGVLLGALTLSMPRPSPILPRVPNPGGTQENWSIRFSCGSGRRFGLRPTSEPECKLARLAPRDFRRHGAGVQGILSTKTAAGEVAPPAAECTLTHPRPGYPLLGCVPAEPSSVSPGPGSLRSRRPQVNVHLDTYAMPPKILRRQPYPAFLAITTRRKPKRTP